MKYSAYFILFIAICVIKSFNVSSHSDKDLDYEHGDHHDHSHHHQNDDDHDHGHHHHDQESGVYHQHQDHSEEDHHDHSGHDHIGHNPTHGKPGHKCSSDMSLLLSEEEKHTATAIMLTFVSGMAAMIGGIIVVFIGEPSHKLLGHLLSFASGVMLYISYCDLLGHAQAHLGEDGFFLANVWMFVGMAFFFVVVTLIPEPEISEIIETNPVDPSKLTTEELKRELKKYNLKHSGDRTAMVNLLEKTMTSDKSTSDESRKRLMTTGIIAAIGISLHNFPEGLVVYNATLTGICEEQAPSVFDLMSTFSYVSKCMGRGLAVSMAIALHNIPEGMAVAMPIYAATRSRWQALKWCLLSSICEPLAAVLFGIAFNNYLTRYIIQVLNALVAGIMIMLCLVELIPAALEHLSPKEAALSNVVGQVVMFLSLHFLIEAGAH